MKKIEGSSERTTKLRYNLISEKRKKINLFQSEEGRLGTEKWSKEFRGADQGVGMAIRDSKRWKRVEEACAASQMGLIQSQKSDGSGMSAEEEIGSESVCSNPSMGLECLTSKTYEQLLASHQSAREFVTGLGEGRERTLNEAVAAHCSRAKLGAKSSQAILDLMEARLNKMVKNNKIKKNWSEDDLHILVWLLSKYLDQHHLPSLEALTPRDWAFISSLIPGSTPRSCMFKFVSLRKFKLAHHKWQKDEEQLLTRIINEIGTSNWKRISERLFEESPHKRIFRTAKQCREHWSCYLNPAIKKGPWDKDEDRKLLETVLRSGCQKKWSFIKDEFEGRTENALKNRYNLLLEKQRKLSPHSSEAQLIQNSLREDRQETPQPCNRIASEKTEARTHIQIPVPIIPEERRNIVVPYNTGFIFYVNGPVEDHNVAQPLSTWFFQV